MLLRALFTTPFIALTNVRMLLIPLSAALIRLTAWPMLSKRAVNPAPRSFKLTEAKKLVGLSIAVLTLRWEAKRSVVRPNSLAEFCSWSRLLRMPALSDISDMIEPFWFLGLSYVSVSQHFLL